MWHCTTWYVNTNSWWSIKWSVRPKISQHLFSIPLLHNPGFLLGTKKGSWFKRKDQDLPQNVEWKPYTVQTTTNKQKGQNSSLHKDEENTGASVKVEKYHSFQTEGWPWSEGKGKVHSPSESLLCKQQSRWQIEKRREGSLLFPRHP